MDLATARTNISSLLNKDSDSDAYSDSEMNTTLSFCLDEIVAEISTAGVSVFNTTETVTPNSSGELALSGSFKVVSVAMFNSGHRFPVRAARKNTVSQNVGSISGVNFEVTYVKKPTFPASDSATFDYGAADSANAILDNYLCISAASQLAMKFSDTEQVQLLERRKAQLREAVINMPNSPNVYMMPYSNSYPSRRFAPYTWFMKDNLTIQLGYPGSY